METDEEIHGSSTLATLCVAEAVLVELPAVFLNPHKEPPQGHLPH